MGSIRKARMFPLDFEEFLYANSLNEFAISTTRKKFERLEALDDPPRYVIDLIRSGTEAHARTLNEVIEKIEVFNVEKSTAYGNSALCIHYNCVEQLRFQ